mmetsp:Transcript_7201/g.15689  ORF Transcript_7201/g.15689 Transcript_7201/m.15689 type:complete len:213 (+) Transcript_7201:1272-1910(+)
MPDAGGFDACMCPWPDGGPAATLDRGAAADAAAGTSDGATAGATAGAAAGAAARDTAGVAAGAAAGVAAGAAAGAAAVRDTTPADAGQGVSGASEIPDSCTRSLSLGEPMKDLPGSGAGAYAWSRSSFLWRSCMGCAFSFTPSCSILTAFAELPRRSSISARASYIRASARPTLVTRRRLWNSRASAGFSRHKVRIRLTHNSRNIQSWALWA